MEKYKYKAFSPNRRPTNGVISAANEVDLYNQLQSAGLELITCSPISKGGRVGTFGRKVKIEEIIELFIHFEQMQGAGISILESLADIRDSSENAYLRDVISEIHREVSEGVALSESMAKHPKVFAPLYISLIAAGEETGDMPAAYRNLLKYLKWVADMQAKIKKATTYPTILLIAVFAVMFVMMGFVVPQIVGFIKNIGMELPFATRSLIATSDFFSMYWLQILIAPFIIFGIIVGLRKMSRDFCYHMDRMMLSLPVAGNLIRKINIARFCQTFASLFNSGMDVLSALKSSQETVQNLALSESMSVVLSAVQSGAPLSEALNMTGELPSMVVRMVGVGEQSGNMSEVLEHVSEKYSKDVDEAIQGLITMIEPALTAILGGTILWIAVGVFGPIYDSFGSIEF